jgi:hypothetical protein
MRGHRHRGWPALLPSAWHFFSGFREISPRLPGGLPEAVQSFDPSDQGGFGLSGVGQGRFLVGNLGVAKLVDGRDPVQQIPAASEAKL